MTTGPEAGYYADPSIPGYIRYWDGTQWVPGTSRPAPDLPQQQDGYAQTQDAVHDGASDSGSYDTSHYGATQSGDSYGGGTGQGAASQAHAFEEAALQQSVAAQLTQSPAAASAPQPGYAAQSEETAAPAQVASSVATMVVPSAFAHQGAYSSGWSSGASGSPFDAIPGLYRSSEPEETAESPEVRVVELASAGSRILARIIDLCIAVVLSLPVTVTLVLIAHRHDHSYVNQLRLHAKTTYRTLGMDAMGIGLWAGAVLVVLLTAIIFESYRLPRSGQTTGRRMVGVRVVTVGTADEVSGGAAGTRAFLFWLLALIPVVDVLALGGVLWGRPYRQGLHEKVSRTLTIRA